MSELAQNPRHTSANPSLSEEIHLHIPSILGLADTRADCGTLLLLMSEATSVAKRERSSKSSCSNTADTGGCPECQLTFHYRLLPVLLLLQMPRHIQKRKRSWASKLAW